MILCSALPVSTADAAGSGEPPPDEAFWSRPRCLRLAHTDGDRLDVCYHDGTNPLPAGQAALDRFLRDRHENVSCRMDPRLFDILAAIQAWAVASGLRAPILIHSGYRTPRTNASIEGAARNSLHMRCMAVDFSVAGSDSVAVGRLAAWFRGGGVGFYPEGRFTHVDTGSVRQWVTRGQSGRWRGRG